MADGRRVEAIPFILKSVKVGEAEVKNVYAATFKEEVTSGADGLLGMTFLDNFVMQIDAKNNKLVLEEFTP